MVEQGSVEPGPGPEGMVEADPGPAGRVEAEPGPIGTVEVEAGPVIEVVVELAETELELTVIQAFFAEFILAALAAYILFLFQVTPAEAMFLLFY